MLQKKKQAVEGGVGEQARPCVALSLCMAIVITTLAFLAYLAFFRPGGEEAGGLYKWWRTQDCGDRLATSPAAGDAAAGSVRPPTTLSHIVFGIASSARTWDKRRGYAELWWLTGKMRGHVWLDKEPASPWPAATSPPYRVSPDAPSSQFGGRVRASASRRARIVADSFLAVAAANDTGRPQVRWFVMGDDDTVFFPENLVAVLGKYDHEDMYYVGAPSESVEQNVAHSYGMAFGGGGFAVSYPAAAELAKVIDGCLDRYRAFFSSDDRVYACLSELGIPLTREPGFHQLDIRGDAYGMLAAHPVAPLVSLHHLDHIDPISPHGRTQLDAVRSLVGASRFDPARSLQQCFCYHKHGPGYNWSVSIAWGYTAQLYPWAVAPYELEAPLLTFKTWKRKADGPFVFNTRPWSLDNPCARPTVFFLSQARNETNGAATMTEYSRHVVQSDSQEECGTPSFRSASAIRTVRVLSPKMSPSDWKRAPWRHCCKVDRTVRGSHLEVQIQRCSRGEHAT